MITFIFYILIFVTSFILLSFSGRWLIDSLKRISEFLGWKEFVVAFFITAFSVSLPNFFVGIISALNKVPELSFGDIVGGNVAELAFLGGLAALISRRGLSANSRTVQGSSIFAIIIALLPLILGADGNLSRSDGVILILAFVFYIAWLFNKKERFEKIYDEIRGRIGVKFIFKTTLIFIISVFLLLISAQGVVKSALFFADYLKIPVTLVGILIVSFGNSLPDLSFVIQAAKKSHDWLLLGDLIGGTIITATLVLGIVSLISPIKITEIPSIIIGRIFLIISAFLFLFFIRTGQKITKKEGIILLLIYIVFIIVEILIR
jgi:cation:H+ antiporter